jgi:Domain of unknown function (DUF3576)
VRLASTLISGIALFALAGCGISSNQLSQAQVNNYQDQGTPGGQPTSGGLSFLFGKGTNNNGGGGGGTNIAVNAYLWRATLDTLAFMPLASADPFGGVIITDWYSPPGQPNERFKADAYILGSQLTANALQVSVFHQVQQNGQWVNAPTDPTTVSGLEDRILARAADLQSRAHNAQS